MNIRDISPLLSGYFMDVVVNESQIEENEILLIEVSKKLGQYYNYLNRLHDSWILSNKVIDNTFKLLLNDFTTHVFADALVKQYNLDIKHENLVFPIRIEFEVSDLSFNIVNDKGFIHRIEPLPLDEYLYENIIAISKDYVHIGIVAWKKNCSKKIGRKILILLKAKSISLLEGQEEAWQTVFGNEFNDIYHYFRDQYLSGRFLSDQSICYEFIEEYKNKK